MAQGGMRPTPRKDARRADRAHSERNAGRSYANGRRRPTPSESGSRPRQQQRQGRSSRPQRRGPQVSPIVTLAAIAVVAVALLAWGASAVTSALFAGPDEKAASEQGQAATPESDGVTFCAVGDNLMNENLLELVDAQDGSSGDGSYDFASLYQDIRPTVEGYDIAFVNQETVLGGTDKFGYAGYPSYNTPDSMADALEDAGFDVVNTNSNHTYDIWVDAILHQQQVFAAHPALTTVGSYASEQDRETPRVVERDGIRFAFLSYSYGQNGYELSDLPNDYYAAPYSAEAMDADVARAKAAADVVVVYMHGGTEYANEPDDWERQVAQHAADLHVDLVIGSHVHVIQPVEWVEASDASTRTLVAYGLGDFVSGYHDYPDCIMSGMLSCTFVPQDDGSIAIEDVVWHPLIEHWEDGKDTVMLVSDYTEKLAKRNELLAGLDDPYGWIVDKTREVMGDTPGVKMDM
ncbi:MAG: CapA family protein [Atopobiaceae bacterium]|nr:CapA family protein [Atopobiaceae bacterium]MCH4119096.1 CapA family protein [Atopobiaceae bacterium]MCI1318170.1 CapA family protein [Atopobiaceae bacterium]MCI1388645.1 CapA family protein [Atopobiaceae bacterium]MCI1432144.1 CapA family protein [Atopobiaceae bacterium]